MLLKMTCDKCRVAGTCPSRGKSPLRGPGGRLLAFCHIIGGYGRDPVDPAILSPESKERAEKDGPCLTIAEVPCEDGTTEVVKIFSHPVRHGREGTKEVLDGIIPKGGGL